MVYVLWVLWAIFWWGVLFFCLCTTTSVCVSCCPYSLYSFLFLPSCYVLCNCFLIHTSHLVLLVPIGVSFIHTLGESMHMYFTICIYMCILKYVYLIYFTISDVISQDSKVNHVIF